VAKACKALPKADRLVDACGKPLEGDLRRHLLESFWELFLHGNAIPAEGTGAFPMEHEDSSVNGASCLFVNAKNSLLKAPRDQSIRTASLSEIFASPLQGFFGDCFGRDGKLSSSQIEDQLLQSKVQRL